MRVALRALLILVTLAGLLFTGQGMGFVRGSFMTGRPEWAVIGAVMAGVGVLALWWTTRR